MKCVTNILIYTLNVMFQVQHFKFILYLRIGGRIGAIILLSKKNCGIPYSFLPSLLFPALVAYLAKALRDLTQLPTLVEGHTLPGIPSCRSPVMSTTASPDDPAVRPPYFPSPLLSVPASAS
jgi:hypothetical protein